MTNQWVSRSEREPGASGMYFVYVPTADEDKPYFGSAWFEVEGYGAGNMLGWQLLPEVFCKAITHWMKPSRPAAEPEADPMPDMAHLDAVQLRRIIARHVRFREEAVRLLQQVDTGYEGEWPEIRQFLERVNARLVLAENRGGEHG